MTVKAAVLNQVGDDKLELRDDVTTTAPGPRRERPDAPGVPTAAAIVR